MSQYITAFIDGAARSQGSRNPTEGVAACVVYANKKEIARFAQGLGPVTNNYAEYSALINVLLICAMMDVPRPIIYCDSLVVVNHVKGIWHCKSPDLLPLYLTVKDMQESYDFEIIHVPRKIVYVPDHMCNVFLDKIAEERKRLNLPRVRPQTHERVEL